MARRTTHSYSRTLTPNPASIPQTQALPGREAEMVQTKSGGVNFRVSPWTRLNRFLILGTETNGYYDTALELTVASLDAVRECLAEDPIRVIERIAEVSHKGLAHKQAAGLLALALAATYEQKFVVEYAAHLKLSSQHYDGTGDQRSLKNTESARKWLAYKNANQERYAQAVIVRRAALAKLPIVCRTPSTLIQFLNFLFDNKLCGWTASLRGAVAKWFEVKGHDDLAFQMTKYRQRDGYSMADLLALSHPHPQTPEQNALFRWTMNWNAKKDEQEREAVIVTPELRAQLPAFIPEFEAMQAATSVPEVVRLLRSNRTFQMEHVPSQFLGKPEVWETLLENAPLGNIFRTLTRMAGYGMLTPTSESERFLMTRLENRESLTRARIHPLSVLLTMKLYAYGATVEDPNKTKQVIKTWTVNQRVVDLLDSVFYLCFEYLPAWDGDDLYIAIDNSYSMLRAAVPGVPNLNAAEAAAAFGMMFARNSPRKIIFKGFADKVIDYPFNAKARLDEIAAAVSRNGSATNAALPIEDAIHKNYKVGGFVLITDNETWAGTAHPSVRLAQYRQKVGHRVRLISLATAANGISVADPQDVDMFDMAGFSPDIGTVAQQFFRGEL